MRKKFIIESQYLVNYENPQNGITVGGSQRYALELSKMFYELGYDVIILCKGNIDYDFIYNGIYKIKVLKAPFGNKGNLKFSKKVYDVCCQINPIVACYSDLQIAAHYCYKNSFALQHGIAWDNPTRKLRNFLVKHIEKKSLKKFKKIICVDTNYINWLRSCDKYYFSNQNKFIYIPNFADEDIFKYEYKEWDNNNFKLLYPRRLVRHRGYDIFTKMCIELIKEGYKITPVYTVEKEADINKIKSCYPENINVEIVNPNFKEMNKYYKDCFLSYIPTLWSEGTSLSAIESIVSGCPVISSDVGGLGNIVIPDLDGYIVSPTVENFANITKYLINNVDKRNELSKNCKIFTKCLSVGKWKERVYNAIKDLL